MTRLARLPPLRCIHRCMTVAWLTLVDRVRHAARRAGRLAPVPGRADARRTLRRSLGAPRGGVEQGGHHARREPTSPGDCPRRSSRRTARSWSSGRTRCSRSTARTVLRSSRPSATSGRHRSRPSAGAPTARSSCSRRDSAAAARRSASPSASPSPTPSATPSSARRGRMMTSIRTSTRSISRTGEPVVGIAGPARGRRADAGRGRRDGRLRRRRRRARHRGRAVLGGGPLDGGSGYPDRRGRDPGRGQGARGDASASSRHPGSWWRSTLRPARSCGEPART